MFAFLLLNCWANHINTKTSELERALIGIYSETALFVMSRIRVGCKVGARGSARVDEWENETMYTGQSSGSKLGDMRRDSKCDGLMTREMAI